jgi:hypothetical protein
MPPTFRDLPPDHPIFHGGVSFVFRDELPEDEPASEQDDAAADEKTEQD